MTEVEELFELAKKLQAASHPGEEREIVEPLERLNDAANEVKRSFSGSWLGYHSRVYYANLAPPPPNANFSQEWGLDGMFGSTGDWRQFDAEEVKKHIRKVAGNPSLKAAHDAAAKAKNAFLGAKSETMSILQNETEEQSDQFLDKLKDDLANLTPMSPFEIAEAWSPKGRIMTRDTLAMGQGTQIPPHIDVLSDVFSVRHAFAICKTAAEICTKAASHLERKSRRRKMSERVGTNVFIGHGQSKLWRELKDFIQDRLRLPWDEFNRVPVAGITNIARLSEMLDAAAIALLVMTAEDEMSAGQTQARMNVIHEAGLFQGRLGFTKAIILLEEGCAEFSNIQGLGQIRFPKGNISACFEEIRKILEREDLLAEGS